MLKKITVQTAANLRALVPSAVPDDRLEHKVLRTFIGALFVIVGVGVLLALVLVPVLLSWKAQSAKELSLALTVLGLAGGLGMVVLGATVWSSDLVQHPLALTVATVKGIYRTVRPAS
jgi:hypothetical protein